ncbi:MAG: hypothetical protein M1308_04800 [Actinobacteria bacterium]|nr:hypothetical protein [Actinomycetota bacterium]
MKILITGGAGFIGINTTEYFLKRSDVNLSWLKNFSYLYLWTSSIWNGRSRLNSLVFDCFINSFKIEPEKRWNFHTSL